MKEIEKSEEIIRLNITDQVYSILKERIKDHSLPAGEHLVERRLARELKVSKTPVREAIAKLEKDGLVIKTGRGMVVRRITRKEVEDILQIRMMIEAWALGILAEDPPQGLIEALLEIQKDCERALERDDLEEYKRYDHLFHNAIYEATGNKEILKIIQGLRDRIYIVMSTSVRVPGRAEISFKEHKMILEAMENRDPKRAIQYGKKHIFQVQEIMEKELRE